MRAAARAVRRARLAALAVLTVGWLSARGARAQQYLIGATAEAATGAEAGGASGVRRARTRLRIGADLRIDESPRDGVSVAAIADLEPRASFGADLRYVRLVGTHFAVNAGAIGYFAPATLLGACAGLQYRWSLSPSAQLVVGPEADFFALGSDLPDGTVVWQALLQGGFRVDL